MLNCRVLCRYGTAVGAWETGEEAAENMAEEIAKLGVVLSPPNSTVVDPGDDSSVSDGDDVDGGGGDTTRDPNSSAFYISVSVTPLFGIILAHTLL